MAFYCVPAGLIPDVLSVPASRMGICQKLEKSLVPATMLQESTVTKPLP